MSTLTDRTFAPRALAAPTLSGGGRRPQRLLAALGGGWQRLLRTRTNRAALFAGQEAALALQLRLLQPTSAERRHGR